MYFVNADLVVTVIGIIKHNKILFYSVCPSFSSGLGTTFKNKINVLETLN